MPDVRIQETILHKLNDIVDRCDRVARHVAALDHRLRETTPAEPQPHRLYTRKEVARLLGVTTRTIDRRIRSGDLEVIRRGTSIRVVGASIHSLRRRPAAILTI